MLAQQQMEFMIAVFRNYQKRDWAEVGGVEVPIPKNSAGYHNQSYMATAPVYGSSSLDENPTLVPRAVPPRSRPWDWYRFEVEITEADPNLPDRRHHPRGEQGLAARWGLHGCPALRRPACRRSDRTPGPVQELRREGHHRPADRAPDGVPRTTPTASSAAVERARHLRTGACRRDPAGRRIPRMGRKRGSPRC